jgi:hypothetical protein
VLKNSWYSSEVQVADACVGDDEEEDDDSLLVISDFQYSVQSLPALPPASTSMSSISSPVSLQLGMNLMTRKWMLVLMKVENGQNVGKPIQLLHPAD